MKKIISLGMMLAAAFTLTNCAKEIDNPVQQQDAEGYPFEIVAKAVQTKTVNNDMSTEWVSGDAVNLFHVLSEQTNYSNDGKFAISEDDLADGIFRGTLKGELDGDKTYDWFAFYPYNSNVSTPANKGTNGYVNVGAKTQTQVGNSNMDHVAGVNFPLAGVERNVSGKPEIEMNHLASLLRVHVTNNSSAPITVTGVTFAGTEDIVGTYFIDFTDLEAVGYTSSGANYVSAATSLVVENGEEVPVGGTADFYIGIKPFTAAAGSTLSLGVNTCIKEITIDDDVTFAAGKIKTMNFSYVDTALPVGITNIKSEASANGSTFAVTLKDAVVTYVSGSNAYIEDEEAGILIYASGHGLKAGDKLDGDVSGTVKLYNNLREITAIDYSKAEKTSGAEVPVTVLTLAELNAEGAYDKYENMRIKVEGAEITADKVISQNGHTYDLYYKSSPLTGFDLYNIVDVVGYPTKFKTTVQLNVWENAVVKSASVTTFTGFRDVEVEVGAVKANKATASSGATPKYVSSDTSVATVDEDGNVTGVKEGTTTITASVEAYNGYPAAEATCTVTVVAAGEGGNGEPAETPCYVLDTSGELQGSNNNYNNNCDITVEGITWNVNGNTKINPWRIGGKSITAQDRTVYSKTFYPSELSKVEFVSGKVTATWNSMKLVYSTDSDFSNAQTIEASEIGASKTIVFSPAGGFPEDCYFKFVLNVTVEASSNKYIELKEIRFYGYE